MNTWKLKHTSDTDNLQNIGGDLQKEQNRPTTPLSISGVR